MISPDIALWICLGDACINALSLAIEKALKVFDVGLSALWFVCFWWIILEDVFLIILAEAETKMNLLKLSQLKGSAGSKRQHVHGCSVVQARKLYGYKSSEEFFFKIFLYPINIFYYCAVKITIHVCTPVYLYVMPFLVHKLVGSITWIICHVNCSI